MRKLARFRAWFEAFDAVQFDGTIERDVQAGKLDRLAEEALAAHRAGRSRELWSILPHRAFGLLMKRYLPLFASL